MATAAYIAQRDAFGRSVQWMVEIELDRCARTYTTAPCTASDLGDGKRCWYSWTTCQDMANYSRTTRVYRFCLNDVPWPDPASPAFPLLESFVSVPQEIDAENLSVYPASLTLRFLRDFNPAPPDHDKGSGKYNTTRAGEFWAVLKARNRAYAGRPVRIYRGFYPLDGTAFALSDFEQIGPTYKLSDIVIEDDRVTIKAASPLADLSKQSIPWGISEDNTLQQAATDASTTLYVRRAEEYPNPADYTRNTVYVMVETEVMKVTARDTAANTLTVERAHWGTTAAAHAGPTVDGSGNAQPGCKVTHVCCFGTDNGASAPSARNAVDVIRDVLEWIGYHDADLDTAAFDAVKTGAWPTDDICGIVKKSRPGAEIVQEIRETRGILLLLDASGKWSCRVMAPNTNPLELDDERFVDGSVVVDESEEARITRVAIWYDPLQDNAKDSSQFQKAVVVADVDLESVNGFGKPRSLEVYDNLLWPSVPASRLRNLALRLVTRMAYGVRATTFRIDLRDDSVNAGDDVLVTTDQHLGSDGTAVAMPCIVVARKEATEAITELRAVDHAFGGRFLKIAPDAAAENFDDMTDAQKAVYGAWCDSNNRVGAMKADGYRIW